MSDRLPLGSVDRGRQRVDLLYIVVIIAFFALMVVFVRLCERIVGTDDAPDTQTGADSPVT